MPLELARQEIPEVQKHLVWVGLERIRGESIQHLHRLDTAADRDDDSIFSAVSHRGSIPC